MYRVCGTYEASKMPYKFLVAQVWKHPKEMQRIRAPQLSDVNLI